MIKAVLFDLWNTLVYSDREVMERSEGEIVAHLRSFNPEVTAARYRSLRKKYHVALTTGKLSPARADERIVLTLGVPKEAADFVTGKVEESMRENMRVYPGVGSLLSTLHALDLKLGLVTNCMEGTMTLIKAVGLDVFDSYGFSNEVGARKPDPKIYVKVTGALNVQPEECVFVSDEIFEDLVGAHALGMRTIHVRQKQRWGIFDVNPDKRLMEPDASVDSILGVEKIIRAWLHES